MADRLFRFEGDDRAPHAGLVRDGAVLKVTTSMPWETIVRDWAAGTDVPTEPVGAHTVQQLLPPISDVSRIFCVAQNYPAHAAEAGGDSPPVPIVFMKPPSAFVGAGADIQIPRGSDQFDYEGELAVVIGKAGRPSTENAWDFVAGVTLANDGSARERQPATLAGRFQVDWFAAKSHDRGSSMGPEITPLRDAARFDRLRIQTALDGNIVQDDVAASMYHSVPATLAHIASIVALRPGDVVLTGTPAGVGKARGRYPESGEHLRISCGELGTLENRFVQAD